MKVDSYAKAFAVLLHPVRFIADQMHKRLPDGVVGKVKKHHLHIVCGMVLMLVGCAISSIEVQNHLVHLALDAFGYSVHACGCAPIIKVIADVIGMEV